MSIYKTAGTKIYISPTTFISDTVNNMTDAAAIAFFAALADWVEIEEVENLGDIGDTAASITFTAIGNRRVRKLKGPRDAGTQNITVARDPLAVGQAAVVAAEKTDFNYPFRIVLADQPDATYGPSTMYYGGLVMSQPVNFADAMAVTRRTFNVGINTAIFEVLAAVASVPVNTLRPSIYGTAVQTGVVLTALEGTWTNSPTSFTYNWQHDTAGNNTFVNMAVPGTSKTYTPLVGNVGNSLRCQVMAVNAAGSSAAANSIGTGLQIA